MGRYSRQTAALAIIVALGVSACSAGDDSSDTGSEAATLESESVDGGSITGVPDDAPADSASSGDGSRVATGEAASPGLATGGSQAPSAPLNLDGTGRAIAVEAGVTIGTPNIRQAVDDTLEVVRRNNASVYTADVNIGDERDDGSIDGSGRIIVKVPPIDLDPLIAELDGTAGTLIGRTQESEDVTEQLIDLDIRIRVEEQTIAQFETLLAQATEFQDIVTIQSVITEHTIVLEQLLASQRNVEQRVDLSTLTIDLLYVPVDAVVDEPVIADDDGLADAFRTGWDAFVGVVFAVGLVLAVGAPFLALGALLLGMVWALARRRPHPAGRRRVRADATRPDHAPVSSDDDQLVGPSPQG